MNNIRIWKNKASKGDTGVAIIYLEALVTEIPEAKSDWSSVLETFARTSGPDVTSRAQRLVNQPPSDRRLSVNYLRAAKRHNSLKTDPFTSLVLLAHQVSGTAWGAERPIDEIAHANTARALESS